MRNVFLLTTLILTTEHVFSKLTDCDNQIYCQGPIQEHVSKAKIFNDSKSFVDLTLKISPNETIDDFNTLLKNNNNNPSKEQIKKFVDDHFDDREELDEWKPPDFKPDPEFLKQIKNETIRDFAKNLVAIWATLGRKTKDEVLKNPELHSLMPLPNGFIIPGGRFKEIYYWDTFWVIEGLLISEMTTTVKGILENFSSLLGKYGFIPNGSRIYYLDRSHPPFFTLMVYAYVMKTGNVYWLKNHLALIDDELMYFINEKTVNVTIGEDVYTLAHYISGSKGPRPESYGEDVETCSVFKTTEETQKCYNELHTGAESGWDFSSRWFFDDKGANNANLSSIETTRLIPVELNALLVKNFMILEKFYTIFGNTSRAKFWDTKASEWSNSLEKVLYYQPHGIWYDFDTKLSQHRKMFYPSNLSPLALEILDPKRAKERGCLAAEYIKTNGIDKYPGGTPASTKEGTGQQWDYPNAWPPLQDSIISGLYYSGCSEAKELGESLGQKWLDAMIIGYQETKKMFEKYDARIAGQRGGGGEYQVQTGFGWTNGFSLKLIENIVIKKNA